MCKSMMLINVIAQAWEEPGGWAGITNNVGLCRVGAFLPLSPLVLEGYCCCLGGHTGGNWRLLPCDRDNSSQIACIM